MKNSWGWGKGISEFWASGLGTAKVSVAKTWLPAANPEHVLGSREESLRLATKPWSFFQLILIVSRKTCLQDTRTRVGMLGFSHLRKQIFQLWAGGWDPLHILWPAGQPEV